MHSEVCTAEGVSGYPTFHHYEFGKKDPKGYGLGREEEDFVAFMSDPANPKPVGQGKHWKAVPGFENLIFLDGANYEDHLAAHDALFVKFYAPCELSVHGAARADSGDTGEGELVKGGHVGPPVTDHSCVGLVILMTIEKREKMR